MTTYRLSLLHSLLLTLAACGTTEHVSQDHEHDHDESAAHAEESERGPHGGRMLRHGDLAVELAIFERGVPPEFRAWLYREDRLLPAEAGQLSVELARLGGVVDRHRFAPRDDYLRSDALVYEPHSFEATVRVQVGDAVANWRYSSHEGRTRIAAATAAEAGIRVAAVGPGTIRDEHEVQGLITTIEGHHARLAARFPGPIRTVAVGVGAPVRAGQTLATVESNVSLSVYAVTSPINGVVLSRQASVGELAGDEPLFEVADLSALWVDVHLFGADAQHITPGLPIVVTRLSDGEHARTTLDRVLPVTATASQSTVARATLDNTDGQWRPGAAVRARVTVAEHEVPLIVPLAALQRYRDWEVVFVRVGEEYEVRPLELGRRDAAHAEVLEGLRVGDDIVVEQSYLVKADIEKAGASHDH